MKPHLLYIAFWFPPSRASGVYRALATVNEFLAAGWEVTVVTTTSDFFHDEIGSIDTSLLAYVPDEVDVVRVPFTLGLVGQFDIRSMSRFSATFPTLWAALRRKLAPVRSLWGALEGSTTESHQMTDNYVAWIDPMVKAGLRIDSRRPVDHVLATGNPYSSFEAARLLAGLLGVGFSVDYRDPWTIDVFTGRLENADRKTTEAERCIIDEATACFHVNHAIADAYRQKYPDTASKHHVAYNGYDTESIPPISEASSGPLRLGILGTLNDRWPIEPLFKAWSDVRPSLPVGSELILGGHLGYFSRSQDLLEAYLPDESTGFRYVGPISKVDVADFYASLDVVVVPVPGGPMVTSGKVFEALALGKPFVCVQSEQGGARALTEKSLLAIGAEPEPRSISAALLKATEMARNLDEATSERARSEAAKYERHRALSPMIRLIDERAGSALKR